VSDLRFDERVALVTRAGSGRGRALALTLAERGAKVVVNDVQAARAARVAKEIEDRGGTAMPNSDGVDTPEAGQAIVDAVLEGFGGLDIVVHRTEEPTDLTSPSAVLSDGDPLVLLAGMFGGYWLARAAWVHMRQRRYGRIIFDCLLDGSIADALDDGNAVTGMGLVGLMNILKVEGPEYNVKVNMVVPTTTADPAAVGDAVAYLAHEACTPTGEIFAVGPDGLARMFIGVTEGYFVMDLTAEIVRDRLDEFLDPDGFFVPDEASGEITILKRDLGLL
jgi:NAD(P)-dependent dehydrogenase (short-subunit alcohol dehydrogenase family)